MKVPRRGERHRRLIVALVRAHPEGVTTGELFQLYAQAVEDGKALDGIPDLIAQDYEDVPVHQRTFRKVVGELADADELHLLVEANGRRGRTSRIWPTDDGK